MHTCTQPRLSQLAASVLPCLQVQRILMELLNQMDGFDQTVNVKVRGEPTSLYLRRLCCAGVRPGGADLARPHVDLARSRSLQPTSGSPLARLIIKQILLHAQLANPHAQPAPWLRRATARPAVVTTIRTANRTSRS